MELQCKLKEDGQVFNQRAWASEFAPSTPVEFEFKFKDDGQVFDLRAWATEFALSAPVELESRFKEGQRSLLNWPEQVHLFPKNECDS